MKKQQQQNQSLSQSNLERRNTLTQSQLPQAEPPKPQGKSQINIQVKDALFVCECAAKSSKGIVFKLDTTFRMESFDEDMFKQKVLRECKTDFRVTSQSDRKRLSSMKVLVHQLTPYFVNMEELGEKTFSKCKKRAMAHKLRSEVKMDTDICLRDDQEFMKYNTMDIWLSKTQAKISMDDLYVINMVQDVMAKEGVMIGDMWAEYNKEDVPEESKDDKSNLKQAFIKDDPPIPSEDGPTERSEDTMNIKVDSAELILVNESHGNFMPMFAAQCDQLEYSNRNIIIPGEPDEVNGIAQTAASVHYFNSKAGYWEPAIERFGLVCKMSQKKEVSKINLKLQHPLNVNCSIGLVRAYYDFDKVWTEQQLREAKYAKKMAEMDHEKLAKSMGGRMHGIAKPINQARGTIQKRESIINLQDKLSGKVAEAALKKTQQDQDLVSPYAIKNLTDKTITVFNLASDVGRGTLTTGEQVQVIDKSSSFRVQPCVQKNLKFSFEEQLQKQGVDATQNDQFVALEFHDHFHAKGTLKSVPKFNMNSSNTSTVHRVYDKSNPSKREFFILQNSLENQKRVLTVRTQYQLVNHSQTTYAVRIFWVDKAAKKVKVLHEQNLVRGESTPLPDNIDKSVEDKLKVAIKPEHGKKWSDEFKLRSLKDKLGPDANVIWGHDKTYSVLRKVPVTSISGQRMPGVYDFVINPAVIVKNCLPLPLKISIKENTQSEGSRRESKRDSLAEKNRLSASQDTLESYILDKEEEKYLEDIKQTTSKINLKLSFSENFKSTVIALHPEHSTEGDQPIPITDRNGRSFNIFARIDTKKAGLRIVFYSKNCLISHTIEELNFLYQKRPGVFDEDNSNQFPNPVLHRDLTNPISKAVRSDDKEPQPTVYLFDENKNMYVVVKGYPKSVSNAVIIETPGYVGKFEIPHKFTTLEFVYSTHIYQPSLTEQLFTKVVEVSPQYVVVNKTQHKLAFCQNHVTFKEKDRLTLLDVDQRAPFHWSDTKMEKVVKFCNASKTTEVWTSPFKIDDAGTLYVFIQSSTGHPRFYKVSKRTVVNSIFIIVEDMKTAPYKVENLCKDISIRFKQFNTIANTVTCDALQKKPFAWSEHVAIQEHLLNCEFFYMGSVPLRPSDETKKKHKKDKQGNSLQFMLDKLNTSQVITLQGNQLNYKLYVSVYTSSETKVIEFSEKPSKNIFTSSYEKNRSKKVVEESKDGDTSVIDTKTVEPDVEYNGKVDIMSFEIPKINISTILDGNEIINLCFIDLRAQMTTDDDEQYIETSLGRLQIDNQREIEPLYPVMLKPKCVIDKKIQHDHFTMDKVDPMFEFFLNMKTNVPNVTYINMYEFLLREMELKIEMNHLQCILSFVTAITEELDTTLTEVHPIFYSENPVKTKKELLFGVVKGDVAQEEEKDESDEEEHQAKLKERAKVANWRNNTITAEEGTIYIKHYKGNPILLEVSLFKQSGTQMSKEQDQKGVPNVLDMLATLGLNMTNINEAPLKLNALEIWDVFGPSNVVADQLMEHYLSNIKANILRFVGSSDLLGNPVNLVDSLGTGVEQFYRAPKDGFMQGPIQGGLGLIKGTGSLAIHTVGGVAGTVGKITNSLNKGILTLTADEEYQHKKEIKDIKEKPKDAVDGVKKGVKGLGTSLLDGVTGVVTKPVEGAKSGGFGGFMKGIGKGVSGLVVKPVSGVVDVVSKTTQGIENSVGGVDCNQNNMRIRTPRAFYKDIEIFRPYDQLHAEIFLLLRSGWAKVKVKDEKNKKQKKELKEKCLWQPFYSVYRTGAMASQYFQGEDGDLSSPLLILTKSYLIGLDSQLRVEWVRNFDELQQYQINGDSLIIGFQHGVAYESFGDAKTQFQLASPQEAESALETIKEIKHSHEFEDSFNVKLK